MKTALILNMGESSFKASLLYPHFGDTGTVVNNVSSSSHPAIRVATAQAEKLRSSGSCLRITISVTAFDHVFKNVCQECSRGTSGADAQELSSGSAAVVVSRRSRENMYIAPNSEEWKQRQTLHKIELTGPNMSHEGAIYLMVDILKRFSPELIDSISVVGHHVVHGGTGSVPEHTVIVDDEVINAIKRVSSPSASSIAMSLKMFEKVPNVAIFDWNNLQANIPRPLYPREDGATKHESRNHDGGFHGMIIKHVSSLARNRLTLMGKSSQNLIVVHLGNHIRSISAFINDQKVETTPLMDSTEMLNPIYPATSTDESRPNSPVRVVSSTDDDEDINYNIGTSPPPPSPNHHHGNDLDVIQHEDNADDNRDHIANDNDGSRDCKKTNTSRRSHDAHEILHKRAFPQGDDDEEEHDADAHAHAHNQNLAMQLLAHTLAKQIEAISIHNFNESSSSVAGAVDALIFTGSEMEQEPQEQEQHCISSSSSRLIRKLVVEKVNELFLRRPPRHDRAGDIGGGGEESGVGFILDEKRNRDNGKFSNGIISSAEDPEASSTQHHHQQQHHAPVVFVIPADDEAIICDECVKLVLNKKMVRTM